MPCKFCGSDAPLTAEHVFPEWTRSHLLDPRDQGDGTHTTIVLEAGMGVTQHRERSGPPSTWTVKCVCAACNNGWMSRLETAAKPHLLKLMDGRSGIFDDQREVLAAWFVKTALVAGAKFRPIRPVFYEQFHAEGKPSANTRVWLAATNERFHHYTDFRPIRTQKEDEPAPTIANAYSAVIALGQVAAFVLSWDDRIPSRKRLMQRFGQVLVPLWPTHFGATIWPPENGLSQRGLDDLSDAIVSTDEVAAGGMRLNR